MTLSSSSSSCFPSSVSLRALQFSDNLFSPSASVSSMMAAKSGVFGISSSLVESRVSLFEAINAAASANSFSLLSTRQHLPVTRTLASIPAAAFQPITEDEEDDEIPRRRRSSNSLRRSVSPAYVVPAILLPSAIDSLVNVSPATDESFVDEDAARYAEFDRRVAERNADFARLDKEHDAQWAGLLVQMDDADELVLADILAWMESHAADVSVSSAHSLPALDSASIDCTFDWLVDDRPSFDRAMRDQAEESMLQATLAEMLRRADPNRLPSSSSLPNVAAAASAPASSFSSSSSSSVTCSYSDYSMDTTTFSAWGEEYFANQTASFDLMATRDSFQRAMQDVTLDEPVAASATVPDLGIARSGSFLLSFLLAAAEKAGYRTDVDKHALAKALTSAANSLVPAEDAKPVAAVVAKVPAAIKKVIRS